MRLHAGPMGLRAAFWPAEGAEAGLAILLPGRTEYLEKYAATVGRLAARGFAVASLDWRGQGLSDRDPAVGRLGHVARFAEYQADLAALLAWAPVAARTGPRLMLAHSMGGCIGLRALMDGALAAAPPDAAVFSAPMWGLAHGPLKAAVSSGVAMAGAWLRQSRRPAPGRGGMASYVLSASLDDNMLTGDPQVWALLQDTARRFPELTVGAPTLGWSHAAFREMAALLRARPKTPRLLLLGDDESVVSALAIRAHAARGGGAQLASIECARHEPLMEGPHRPAGAATWAAIDNFLAKRGLGAGLGAECELERPPPARGL